MKLPLLLRWPFPSASRRTFLQLFLTICCWFHVSFSVFDQIYLQRLNVSRRRYLFGRSRRRRR
jgi:hypothetical protein